MPLITMGSLVTVGTVQKLSTLLPSSVAAQQKLEAATMVAESATVCLGNENKKTANKKKLPKALGAIREQRLAAKQELKAVRNILEHANFDLDSIFPETPLRPTVPASEIRGQHRVGSEVLAFNVNTSTGESTWAAVLPRGG
ncbi:unnamed protein product [Symbiodinium sp. CCMP2592]|nr:unnamed protein product [Symbiodinium sp. CCMP2592]